MSADNWTTCPQCEDARRKQLATFRDEVRASYGVVDAVEYKRLCDKLAEREQETAPETFREDYEFYGADEGVLHIVYGGSCEACGLSVSVNEERRFWSKDVIDAEIVDAD